VRGTVFRPCLFQSVSGKLNRHAGLYRILLPKRSDCRNIVGLIVVPRAAGR
jgi:hypothetical protein